MKITAEEFEKRVGSAPKRDDLDRVNCKHAGEFGHYMCGWCKKHEQPRFICGCEHDKNNRKPQAKGDKTMTQSLAGKTFAGMNFRESEYKNGAKAIELIMEDGSPYARITVNIPGTELAKDEILVKTWSENEGIANALRDSTFFEDTGRRVPAGWCEAEIWKVR